MKNLRYLLFIFLLMLFISGKVNAETYNITTNNVKFYLWTDTGEYIPSGLNDVLYTNNSAHNYYRFIQTIELKDALDVLYPGQYLIEFYVYSKNSTVDPTIYCSDYTSNFENVNMTTGNWVSNEISSQCVNAYTTTYNGVPAIRMLYKFTYKGANSGADGITELRFSINSSPNDWFFSGYYGFQYGLSSSNIYDYDTVIVDTFNEFKQNQEIINQNNQLINNQNETNNKLDTQINQNQTIIDQNNQTNGILNNSTVDDPSGTFNQFESYLPENGVITQLINLPISLFQRVLTSINGTCSQYNLGNLLGTDLILPCINISNYIGTTLWNVIDILFSGFFVLVIGKKMIKAFNNFSSMEEGDVLD